MGETLREYEAQMPEFGFHKALMAIWECLNHANKYIDSVGPWTLAKDPAAKPRLQTVIRSLLEVNKIAAVLISPFMPATAEKMLERLSVPKRTGDLRLGVDAVWGALPEGAPVRKGEALFPRIETKAKEREKAQGDRPDGKMKTPPGAAPAASMASVASVAPAASPRPASPPSPPASAAGGDQPPTISFETFKSVDLRAGVIREAEKVPKSKKLVRLVVDIGEMRQIVAGIAETHSPEELVGKQVIVVANLQPAKLMGIESFGMVLAVRDGGGLRLLTTEQPVAPGGKVS
jgi:methionyl-tRNA synthetase